MDVSKLEKEKIIEKLPSYERHFLKELEAKIRVQLPIIQNSAIEDYKYGFSTKDGHIVGLGLSSATLRAQ